MAPGRKAKRRREGACRGVLAAEPGSVEVTPQRPRKRHRIRRRGRKPDPCLSSLSHTSSGSSVSMSNSADIEKVSCARRKLGFSSKTSDTVGFFYKGTYLGSYTIIKTLPNSPNNGLRKK